MAHLRSHGLLLAGVAWLTTHHSTSHVVVGHTASSSHVGWEVSTSRGAWLRSTTTTTATTVHVASGEEATRSLRESSHGRGVGWGSHASSELRLHRHVLSLHGQVGGEEHGHGLHALSSHEGMLQLHATLIFGLSAVDVQWLVSEHLAIHLSKCLVGILHVLEADKAEST